MHCLKFIAVIFAGRAAFVFYKVTLENGNAAKHSHECAAEHQLSHSTLVDAGNVQETVMPIIAFKCALILHPKFHCTSRTRVTWHYKTPLNSAHGAYSP